MEKLQRYQTPIRPGEDHKEWDTLTRYINQIVEAHGRVLDDITNRPQLDTILLENLALTAGLDNKVQHGLGRLPRGFKLVDLNTAAIVTRSSWDTSFVLLNTTADCTVSIEVF